MKRKNAQIRTNARLGRQIWGKFPRKALETLKILTSEFQLSIIAGDLQLLNGRWYVTHAGLLRLARRFKCSGILTAMDGRVSDPSVNRWVFRQLFSSPLVRRASSATAMPILPIFLPLSVAQRCASLRRGRLTAPCERLTGSASARSRSWVVFGFVRSSWLRQIQTAPSQRFQ